MSTRIKFPVRELRQDDFFELPGSVEVYCVDFVYRWSSFDTTLVATNCRTDEIVAFPRELEVVDFLFR